MVDRFFCSGSLDSNTKGDLSRYTDYAALEQRIKELEVCCQKLEWAEAEAMALVVSHEGHITKLEAENKRLSKMVEYGLGPEDFRRD